MSFVDSYHREVIRIFFVSFVHFTGKERTGTENSDSLANSKLHDCIRGSLRECIFSGLVILAMASTQKVDQ